MEIQVDGRSSASSDSPPCEIVLRCHPCPDVAVELVNRLLYRILFFRNQVNATLSDLQKNFTGLTVKETFKLSASQRKAKNFVSQFEGFLEGLRVLLRRRAVTHLLVLVGASQANPKDVFIVHFDSPPAFHALRATANVETGQKGREKRTGTEEETLQKTISQSLSSLESQARVYLMGLLNGKPPRPSNISLVAVEDSLQTDMLIRSPPVELHNNVSSDVPMGGDLLSSHASRQMPSVRNQILPFPPMQTLPASLSLCVPAPLSASRHGGHVPQSTQKGSTSSFQVYQGTPAGGVCETEPRGERMSVQGERSSESSGAKRIKRDIAVISPPFSGTVFGGGGEKRGNIDEAGRGRGGMSTVKRGREKWSDDLDSFDDHEDEKGEEMDEEGEGEDGSNSDEEEERVLSDLFRSGPCFRSRGKLVVERLLVERPGKKPLRQRRKREVSPPIFSFRCSQTVKEGTTAPARLLLSNLTNNKSEGVVGLPGVESTGMMTEGSALECAGESMCGGVDTGMMQSFEEDGGEGEGEEELLSDEEGDEEMSSEEEEREREERSRNRMISASVKKWLSASLQNKSNDKGQTSAVPLDPPPLPPLCFHTLKKPLRGFSLKAKDLVKKNAPQLPPNKKWT
uniref:HORMA domain-containing protein n=1 Tax=Chromera velia CCMP2878 TaxID=1169474 RepID=A0A0G4HSE3_9ALVE|eukprot:Cvel_1304.t1-p1 / transcript=Cvel_1304.t1 / gene=Cvel_1304 / organism=Chromera_velia_CCMP2878 / gene_product=hypothetical protein / transcript_product=hypothetical protein / location=Cvel_scaffold44:84164-90651(-) / protein_length=626 / sequence_SO=supercontig / SO=protein_coding / is_pseudo=false